MDFSHFTAADWGDLAGAVAVPLIAALLAFGGVIWANNIRRAADRRAEREARMTTALVELKAIPERLLVDGPEDVMKIYDATWQFDWVISDKREQPVADWYSAKILDLSRLRQTTMGPGSRYLHALAEVNDIIGALNQWRTGARKPAWFKREAARIIEGLNEPLVPRVQMTVSATIVTSDPEEPPATASSSAGSDQPNAPGSVGGPARSGS